MSDESKLNPELKKLEASLSQYRLPKSSINRDQLMYQSGWAAALASLDSPTMIADVSGDLENDRQPLSRLAWPAIATLASAAAVVLGVLLTLQIGPSSFADPNQQAADSSPTASRQRENQLIDVASQARGLASTDPDEELDAVMRVLELPAGHVLKSGLAFQAVVWQDPDLQTQRPAPLGEQASSPDLRAEPVNHRQLMDELLPGRRRAQPWASFSF